MKQPILKEASRIWKNIAREINEDEHGFELKLHEKLLAFFQVGDSYHYIFNIKNSAFDFVSARIQNVLGYDPAKVDVPLLINAIHPDDQPWFLNFENKVGEFFAGLTLSQIPNYKVSYDYRIRKTNGEYLRILQQVITLQYNADKCLLRTIGVHTDISHIKNFGKPTLSFIGINGEPSYYNVDVKEVFKLADVQLSPREREILCLIANGNNSVEISMLLSLSRQTVDTHRKHLLDKTDCSNTAELISTAIRSGWI